MERAELQPRLVRLIAGLRHQQVEEAVGLLLDYIDEKHPSKAPLDQDRVRAAARMISDWAELWMTDAHLGDLDADPDGDDPDGLKLVVRVFELLTAQGE